MQESTGSTILFPRSVATGTPAGDSLENLNTNVLANGVFCYVSGGPGQGEWQLQKEATDAPDGTTIVRPIAGPGRWFKKIPPGVPGGTGTITSVVTTAGGLASADTITPNAPVVAGAVTINLPNIKLDLATSKSVIGPGTSALAAVGSGATIMGFNAGLAAGPSTTIYGSQAGAAAAGAGGVYIGAQAGANLTGGASNVAVGSQAMGGLGAYGIGNVAIGAQALGGGLTTGTNNTALGFQAMAGGATTASRNICIGSSAGIPSGTTNDYINIGNYITGFRATGGGTYTGRFGVGVGAADFSTFQAVNVFQNSGGGSDTLPFMEWRHQTTNGANIQWFQGTRDPNGVVTGNEGDLYVRASGTSSSVFQRRTAGSGTSWASLSAGVIGITINGLAAVGVVADPGANSMQTYVLTNAGARTIALPSTAADGARITVKDGNGAGTNITVSVDGGGNIDFAANYVIATIGGSATFQWSAVAGQWWVI